MADVKNTLAEVNSMRVEIDCLRAENAELLATLAKIAENLERAAFVQDRSVNIIKQVIWMQAKDARAAIAKHENKEG